MSLRSYDLLIVGGGPAGLAAGHRAATLGLRTAIVDERVTLGGQIYKQMGPGFVVSRPRALSRDLRRGREMIDAVRRAGVEILTATRVLALEEDRVVLAADGESARTVTARVRLLATGAQDRPVAFPGWTLPGVLTAGGAQTLVKTQGVLPGERILFAGSGPLALAFPAQLHGYGATIAEVIDAGAAPGPADVARLIAAAPGNASILADALRYRVALARGAVPLRYRRIIVRAHGERRVQAVTHAAVDARWRPLAGTEETVEVDTLCLGYGFTPSFELLRTAGCELGHDEDLGGPCAVLDEWMHTTAAGVFAAGDGAGVEGSRVAIAQGSIAGIGAARELGVVTDATVERAAAPARRRLARARALTRALAPMHAVGPGVFELATADTVVCRCEGVSRRELDDAAAYSADANVVRGLTRAGMGLCQGRNCQRQVAAVLAAHHGRAIEAVALATPRLPARPIELAAVADASGPAPARFQ